ncbi:hypothetical protein D915_001567 [Fasciola hepatica]|uniref:LIM zinc-binding domain-containing protein n=1 Tax=Fasciola hepatica TaxID=6192 RepID=A0A4E0RWW1_FASHE|nr:hypothetical protein D915_001567 [Fasciola hepatica]
MAVDLKKNDLLCVSRAVEGCTEEILNHLLPDVQSGIVVSPIVPKENLSETFTKSEILEGISVIPQTTLRKKCTTCGGILHEVNSIEPLANFHNHCFQCSRCMKQLSPLNFKMVGGMPYCEPICQNVRVQKIVQDSKQKSVKPNLLQFIPTKVNVRKRVRHLLIPENHNRNSFVSTERTMNNHTESGLTLFTRNSYTPPMKQRVVRFESRHNSMKNLSKIGSEQHCFVCGKVVYPAFKLAHKSRIYHDTCIRCEKCDRPLTSVDSMHLVKGMVLCSEHSSSVVSSKGNSSAMREISLENLKLINEGDGKTLSVDGPLITTVRPISTVKVSTVPIISTKNEKPPTSPRQISYSIPKSGSPLNENQKEIRVRSSSPFEYAVRSQTSWKGEINRKLKT